MVRGGVVCVACVCVCVCVCVEGGVGWGGVGGWGVGGTHLLNVEGWG